MDDAVMRALRSVQEFKAEQLAVFLSLDIEKMVQLTEKYGDPAIAAWMRKRASENSGIVVLASMHKARAALEDFPAAERVRSSQWLLEHGFSVRTSDELYRAAHGEDLSE